MKVINIWNAPFGEGNWELSEETGKPDGQLHLPGLDTPGQDRCSDTRGGTSSSGKVDSLQIGELAGHPKLLVFSAL